MINEAMNKIVSGHVDEQLYFVKVGNKVDYTQLFDKHLLQSMTLLEHRYVLERALAYLIAFEEIDLVFAGVNDKGQILYERIG